MSPERESDTTLARRGALLLSLLQREKRGHLQRLALRGGGRILALAAAGAVVLVAIAAVRPGLPLVLGWILGAAAWAGLGWLVWRNWVRPLRAVPNLAVFARLVEERRDFRDLLRAGLEFSQRGAPTGESVDLVTATVDRAYDEASRLRLVQLFQFPHGRRDAWTALAAAAALAAIVAVSPQAPARVLHGLAFRWPTPAEIQYGDLQVLSGDRTVLAGEDVEVAVREVGPQAPEMLLRFNDTGDLWKSRALTAAGTPREYTFRFEAVRSDLAYRFESGRRRTDEHRIKVVQRPVVGRLKLRLTPPAYTARRPTELEEGRGDAVALRGSRIEIELESSSGLVSARVVPDPGDAGAAVTLSAPLGMLTDGRTARAGFTLRGDMRYHFALVDSLGHTNADPVTYQLSTVEDREPYVEVRVPGQDADIPQSLQVPIQIYAADDFGVASLVLVHRVEKAVAEGSSELDDVESGAPRRRAAVAVPSDGGPTLVGWSRRPLPVRGDGSTGADGQPLPAGVVTELLHSFTWSLGDAGLFPGDVIAYCVEVVDNDAITGPKKARSPIYRLRLQTISELYAKIQKDDDSRMSQLDDAIEKSRQLKEKYERLSRELKKNPEMDWKKEKDVEGALEKQKQVANQVQKIAEDLEKSVAQMQSQQTVSQEITQKLDEIRKLLEQVEDETMREYAERLQEAMKQISPEEIQRAMEQMNMSQDEYLKRLERTKALLEQLRREQMLDAMIERLSEMLRQQERLGKETQELDKDKKDGSQSKDSQSKDSQGQQKESPQQLAQEQQDLGQKTDELQKELDALAREAAEKQQQGQEKLDQANQQMQQENPSGEMQEASEQLRSSQPQQAQQHQQNAEKTLRALYQQLMQAQQMMSMQAQAEAAAKLQKAARQVLDVSFRQETVAKQPGAAGSEDGDAAEQQQGLLSATGKVVGELDALAQQTTSAPTQVSQLLGQAMAHMREGVRNYERGNTGGGRSQGEEAYGYLNRAVVELNRSLSSSGSCSKPGGGEGSPQQRMDQLMGQQQSLNEMTQKLQQSIPNPQNLSPEERAQMARLLGQQRSIQSELQDIERAAREKKELLGRLDKMQAEMREVVEDMDSQQLDEETLRVQERIVSRMLDAQRSLHKRDFNEERESRGGEEIFSKGGKMPPQSDRVKKLRRDIERALREGTPEEYQDLVREYFRAIGEAPGAEPQVQTP